MKGEMKLREVEGRDYMTSLLGQRWRVTGDSSVVNEWVPQSLSME